MRRETIPEMVVRSRPPAPIPFYAGRRLSSARQNQRDVVRLLLIADPIVNRGGNLFGDFYERAGAMLAYQVNQARLAKLSKIIFRFGDAVAVGEEDVARLELLRAFVEGKIVEKTYHR